ncbi:MAG: NAD(P)-binding domain-containing protein [Alistipes sp.]|nr:NAD(P)-binding domain-containing protein [Alistipes sp.]
MTNGKVNTQNCAVIGYGSWATAIVKLLSEGGCCVRWYIRNPDVLESLREEGRNCKYLRDVEFDRQRLILSDNIDDTVMHADTVIIAAPSAFIKEFLRPLTVSLSDKFVISAVKGIVPDDYATVVDYLVEHYNLDPERTGIITGPSHAEEVGREHLSYLTAVCRSEERAREFGSMFAAPYIRLEYSTDMEGVEYAAIMKNIYAIAVGLAVGLGYGDNFLAVLIANCAREMSRFLDCLFPAERNTQASPYLGDLLVTCYSNYSRNRRLGTLIGRGCTVKSALNEMTMVAEGYYAAECIRHISKGTEAETPIADAVYQVLYKGASARKTMAALTSKLV